MSRVYPIFVLFFVFIFAMSYVANLIKDFDMHTSFKPEVIHGIGVFNPQASIITVGYPSE